MLESSSNSHAQGLGPPALLEGGLAQFEPDFKRIQPRYCTIDQSLRPGTTSLTEHLLLNMSHSALIIVDFQNDFLPPDGSLAVSGGRDLLPILHHLLDKSVWDWDVVIASQVIHSHILHSMNQALTQLNVCRTITRPGISPSRRPTMQSLSAPSKFAVHTEWNMGRTCGLITV